MRQNAKAMALSSLFWQIVKGIKTSEFNLLLTLGTEAPRIYIHDPPTRSSRLALAGEIPWPVEFLMAVHDKHIFSGKVARKPAIAQHISDWYNKRRWQYHLEQSTSASACLGIPFSKLLGSRRTPKCGHDLPPAVEARLLEDKQAIYTACMRAVSYSSSSASPFIGGLCPLVKLGSDIINDGPFVFLKSDKDRCSVAVLRGNFDGLIFGSLVAPFYNQFTPHEDWAAAVCDHFRSIAGNLARKIDAEDPGRLYAVFTRSMRECGVAGLVAKVTATIKTHKEQGNHKPRILHASTRHPFKPVLKLASQLLNRELRKYDHIIFLRVKRF